MIIDELLSKFGAYEKDLVNHKSALRVMDFGMPPRSVFDHQRQVNGE